MHEQLLLLNVCYEFADVKTKQREINGSTEAMKELKLSKSYLITGDELEEIRVGKKIIYVIPAWRWMLKPAKQ